VKLLQIWDYLMRRKPLLVALFVVLISGSCGYRFAAQSHTTILKNLAPVPVAQTIDNGLALQILDEKQVPVYQLTFSNDFQQATIKIGANSLASETYVRILDAAGNLMAGEYTVIYDQAKDATEGIDTGMKYYFPETPKNYQVALAPGMKIELQAQNVKFYSTLDGAEVTEYAPQAQIETYIVTTGGLRRADWDETRVQEVLYQQLKRYAGQEIRAYQASMPEHVLYNKTLDTEKKAEIARLYAQLLPPDQGEYSEFVEQLQKGGAPVIIYRGATEYKQGEAVDLLALLDIHDNEDGEISRGKLRVEGSVDFSRSGSYDITYTATDSDGNATRLALTITVSEAKADTPAQMPSEDRPANTPTDNNAGDGSTETNTHEPVEGAGVGIGVGVGETVMDEAGTVWGALESKVDYVPVATETDAKASEAAEAVDADKKATGATSRSTESRSSQKTERTDEVPNEKSTSGGKTSGAEVFWIVLGLLALCGFAKFIFDHYIR